MLFYSIMQLKELTSFLYNVIHQFDLVSHFRDHNKQKIVKAIIFHPYRDHTWIDAFFQLLVISYIGNGS